MELDYHVSSLEERKKIVDNICQNQDFISDTEKKYLADYLLFVGENKQTTKERKQEYPIVTQNRKKTTNKRESSLEDIIFSLRNGEDGIYGMIIKDKNQLMDPREKITQEDIDNIPGIAENLEVIDKLNHQLEKAKGNKKYQIKLNIIEVYKDIYLMKESFKNITARPKLSTQWRAIAHVALPEQVHIDEKGMPVAEGFSLMNAENVSILLQHYEQFKGESEEDFQSDMKFLLMDLDNIIDHAFDRYPVLYDLLQMRLMGYPGEEIKATLNARYDLQHSVQYYSTLWTQKIPKVIAEQAKKDYITWYYTYQEPMGHAWKKCGKCGKTLLAHPLFFSPNSSKDGLYSICRDCRSRKIVKGDNDGEDVQ